ncbi:unnamed protein product [Effrenium voratum]|nr:unnamed protein product [Effrenium voratum]
MEKPRPRPLLEPEEPVSRTTSKTGSSAPPSPVAKQICRCGTTVLFPVQCASRTCWNCGALLQLSPRPGFAPSPCEVSRPQGLPVRLPPTQPSRPLGLPQEPPVISIPVPNNKWPGAATFFAAGLLLALLLASLLANAALYKDWFATYRGAALTPGQTRRTPPAGTLDTDGDGVPDQDDWCPGQRPQGRSVWISGRASDFDGDGCQDGVEDQDRDNDGIEDKVDRCPFSPQQYNFVSNSLSDFDGDGCKDGVEDQDDDGDGVSNEEDACTGTRPGESSDTSGCSKAQHRRKAQAAEAHAQAQASAQAAPTEPPQSVMSEWVDKLRSAWLEVVLGMLITPILSAAKERSWSGSARTWSWPPSRRTARPRSGERRCRGCLGDTLAFVETLIPWATAISAAQQSR